MKRKSKRNAFTLVEIVISIAITTLIGLGVISSLVFTRTVSEYDKQRIVAINYARSYIEQFRRPCFPTLQGEHQVVLDDFNTPNRAAVKQKGKRSATFIHRPGVV